MKKIFFLLSLIMLFGATTMQAQPNHLTHFKVIAPAENGWYGELHRVNQDSSYSLQLQGANNAVDVGIWNEEMREASAFENVVRHINFDAEMEFQNECEQAHFWDIPMRPIGKNIQGEIIYSTERKEWDAENPMNTVPSISSDIGVVSDRVNVLKFNPELNTMEAVFTVAMDENWVSVMPYMNYREHIGEGWFDSYYNDHMSYMPNSNIAVVVTNYSGTHTINNEQVFANIEGHVGYIASVINFELGDVISAPVISEEGNYSVKDIYPSTESFRQYRIGVVRGDQTKIAADGTLFQSTPEDSLYHWIVTKETVFGDVEWTQRLNAMNNTLGDSTTVYEDRMLNFEGVHDLIEKDERLFISNWRRSFVSDNDDYLHTDFFDQETTYSDLLPGYFTFSGLNTVFNQSYVVSMTTNGDKLVQLTTNLAMNSQADQHRRIHEVGDKLAWVHRYKAVNDTTIMINRADNEGDISSVELDMPAGEGVLILWLNADLEIEDHWVFAGSRHLRIAHMSMMNTDTLMIQGNLIGGEATIFLDPSDDSNAMSLESGSMFFTFYDLGATNGIHNLSTKTVDIKVYPNPARNILNFDMALTQNATYTLTDLSGRIVSQGMVNPGDIHQIDISGLYPGFYLLSVESNDGVGVQKVKID